MGQYVDRAIEYRKKIEEYASYAPDEVATLEPTLYPIWTEQYIGKRGQIVRYEEELYRAIHDIIVPEENDASPDKSVKWQKLGNAEDEWPDWVDPLGIPDNFYHIGDKVTHNSKHWISEVNNNSWAPGAYGWKEAT